MAGRVRLGTKRLDKPGKEYPADAAITLTGDPSKSSSPEQICVLREALRIHKIWSD